MNNNKILLVDDELNIRETITELLIFQNYDVKTAQNGQEALDLLEYWTPDLIICDIMMPVMNGIMLHEIIKDNHSLSSIPFIFLTAKKEKNLMRKCLVSGADDFISKPFKINQLIEIIKAKIERFERIKKACNNLYIGTENHFLNEINTPLNGILGSIDLLIEDEDKLKKNEIEVFYDTIKISGERLNRTMQNLVLYQNLKSNLLQYNDGSNVDILKCFLDVKAKLLQIYDNQGKRITFEIESANIQISQNYLNFILFELIDNALKFSPSSKIIILSGERYDDNYYELVIRDFGIGFSEEELKRIGATQQFNREKNEQKGLGLGLFLSKIIIKKSKGVFTIVSTPNEGSTIKIFLPLSTL
jgi:two-component system sensor histidine kinase/response regulator